MRTYLMKLGAASIVAKLVAQQANEKKMRKEILVKKAAATQHTAGQSGAREMSNAQLTVHMEGLFGEFFFATTTPAYRADTPEFKAMAKAVCTSLQIDILMLTN